MWLDDFTVYSKKSLNCYVSLNLYTVNKVLLLIYIKNQSRLGWRHSQKNYSFFVTFSDVILIKFEFYYSKKLILTGEIFCSEVLVVVVVVVSLCPAAPAGTSASPLTCNICAVFKKSVRCSCPMCTSPLYINLQKKSIDLL